MKRIKAYIKPHKLSEVTLALHRIEEMSGMSVVEVQGFGRLPPRGAERVVDFTPHIQIEIVCKDALVDRIVEVIERTAHTGLRGDGRIFVSPVETSIRISTGEREQDTP